MTISSYLLFFWAVLQVISLGAAIPMSITSWEITKEVYAGTSMEGVAAAELIGLVIVVVIGLLLTAGVVVLAIFNNRGKNPSRIITWVAAGFALCCAGLGLLLTAVGAAMSDIDIETGDPGLPSEAELQERIAAELPGWYEPVSLTVDGIGTLAILAAAILLALPAANEFFRKPPAMWAPPLPGAAYPMGGQYPGHPQAGAWQYPGHPQAGSWQYPGRPQQHPGQPPAAPADPADPANSADPTDPANPANPANPTDPANPADSTNPANPTDSTNTADPANPTPPAG